MYQAQQHTRLRDWLAQRSASERDTLARIWAVPPSSNGKWDADVLADVILQPDTVQQAFERIGEVAREALRRVLAEEGARLPVAVLEREFGTVRSHDQYPNPRAYLLALEQPPSATEKLFTFGLILPVQRRSGRFYAVPDDVRPFLPTVPPRDKSVRLHPVAEPPRQLEADPFELERNAVTLLALAQRGELQVIPARGLNKASLLRLAKRWGHERDSLQGLTYEKQWQYVYFLRSVLEGAGLLRTDTAQELRPTRDGITWLGLRRVERLQRLIEGWKATQWGDLEHLIGIQVKGYAFGRDQAATRDDMLAAVRTAQVGEWVAYDELINEVQRTNPDFLRRDGRYDAWRLVNYRGEHLDGYDYWQAVEGELLEATIGSVLHWLGLIDVGGRAAGDHIEPTCFRISALGAAVLGVGKAPHEEIDERLVVQSTFEVVVPPRVAPEARFWVMCSAKLQTPGDVERYQLTKSSVQDAIAGGMEAERLQQVLEEASGGELPQNVGYSLREWSGQVGQLTLSRGALLRTTDPLLLEQVQRDKRVRMPPAETLAPDTLLLDEGDASSLAERLRKAGYGLLGDDALLGGSDISARDLTVLYGALEFYAAACAELGIDSDASAAMRRRIERLLDQQQRQQASKLRSEALTVLQKAIGLRTDDGR